MLVGGTFFFSKRRVSLYRLITKYVLRVQNCEFHHPLVRTWYSRPGADTAYRCVDQFVPGTERLRKTRVDGLLVFIRELWSRTRSKWRPALATRKNPFHARTIRLHKRALEKGRNVPAFHILVHCLVRNNPNTRALLYGCFGGKTNSRLQLTSIVQNSSFG